LIGHKNGPDLFKYKVMVLAIGETAAKPVSAPTHPKETLLKLSTCVPYNKTYPSLQIINGMKNTALLTLPKKPTCMDKL
jgi:hypothetical protein